MKTRVVLVSGIVLFSFQGVPRSSPARPQTLSVTAGRGMYCLSFTNREAHPLAGCVLSVKDDSGTEWTAASPRPVVPLETRAVEWADFRAGGQRMPDELRDQPVTISCTLPGKVRRSVTLK